MAKQICTLRHYRALYTLDKQIVISRSIIIIGNPVVLPEIDGFKNERIFHGKSHGC